MSKYNRHAKKPPKAERKRYALKKELIVDVQDHNGKVDQFDMKLLTPMEFKNLVHDLYLAYKNSFRELYANDHQLAKAITEIREELKEIKERLE